MFVFYLFFFLLSFWIIPILSFFIPHRISQLRDPRFDLRITAPTHTGLQYFCSVLYGIVYPAFYFLSVRTRATLGDWSLGVGTNRPWTIILGAVCMTWLAAHLLEGIFRLGAPRYRRNFADLLIGALGIFLLARFHFRVLVASVASTYIKTPDAVLGFASSPVGSWILGVCYPQVCFAATMSVYLFAFLESLRPRYAPPKKLPWRLAISLASAAMSFLFLPFWLSIPRVTHTEALRLIQKNQHDILQMSRAQNLDPKLIAGIIYVAHTRDRPRFTGGPLEQICSRFWRIQTGSPGPPVAPPADVSAGLCQMRPRTALQTLAPIWHSIPCIRLSASQLYLEQKQVNAQITQEFFLKQQRYNHQQLLDIIDYPIRANSMAELLLNPRSNLAMAVLMLSSLRDQWERHLYPIDDRPEILATLYNIGYERSNPHANPQPNDFGRRVLKFMNSEECKTLFDEDKITTPVQTAGE